MPFYEYQGQVYEIDTKDKRQARTKIQRHLDQQQPPSIMRQIAREGAGTLDIIGEIPRTAVRGASYIGSRLTGGTPEQAQATAERMAQRVPTVGSITGAEFTPQYEQGSLRQLQSAIGERVAPMIERGAQSVGVDPRDVTYPLQATAAAPMVPSAMLGAQAAGRGLAATGRGAAAAAQGAADFTGGVVRGATRTGQDLVRLGDTFIPRQVIDDVKAGRMSFQEAQQYARPTAELAQGPMGQAAMAIAGGKIPVEGRGMAAFGQRLGESTRSPMSMAADIGFPLLTGVPIPPVLASRAAADLYLSRQAGMLPKSQMDLVRTADLYRQGTTYPVAPGDIATAAAAQAQRGPLPVPETVAPQAPVGPIQAQPNPNNISILRQTYPNLPEADIKKIEVERRAREIVGNSKQTEFPIPADVAKRLAAESVDKDMATLRLQEMQAQQAQPAPQPVAPAGQVGGYNRSSMEQRIAELRQRMMGQQDPNDPRVQLQQAEQAAAAAARPEVGSPEYMQQVRERAAQATDEINRPRTALDDYNEWRQDPEGYIRRQQGPGNVSQMISPQAPKRTVLTEDAYLHPTSRAIGTITNPDGSREVSYQQGNRVVTEVTQPGGILDRTVEFPNGFSRETLNPDGSVRERMVTLGDDTIIEENSFVMGDVPGQQTRQTRTEQWVGGRRSTFVDGRQIKGEPGGQLMTYDEFRRRLEEGK